MAVEPLREFETRHIVSLVAEPQRHTSLAQVPPSEQLPKGLIAAPDLTGTVFSE